MIKAFIFGNWHAWQSTNQHQSIMLSDESTKSLLSFKDVDACINWLWNNGDCEVARQLNAHTRH